MFCCFGQVWASGVLDDAMMRETMRRDAATRRDDATHKNKKMTRDFFNINNSTQFLGAQLTNQKRDSWLHTTKSVHVE